jgi:general stress protein 26
MAVVSSFHEVEKVWKMIGRIRTCMLVAEEGRRLHARPMSAYPDEREHAIFFLTDIRGAKDDVLHQHPEVCLSFVDGSHYVSISGDAFVSNDREKIHELWNVYAQAWFDGPDDPAIRLVRVVPHDAQYWETPGKAATVVSMAIAAATGTRPQASKERKVDMH